ncbi:hypothetical protein HYQ44_011267 [Verticillium longisporum]|nr:hypothetical protein HYQ44_011267 [Verticillium longisporum]
MASIFAMPVFDFKAAWRNLSQNRGACQFKTAYNMSIIIVKSVLSLAIPSSFQVRSALQQATKLALAVLVVEGLSGLSSFMTSKCSAKPEPTVSDSSRQHQ